MNVSVQMDKTQEHILAVYLRMDTAEKVARTVEIEQGACYADEGAKGNLIGVEMLSTESLGSLIRRVPRKYGVRGMTKALRNATSLSI